MSRWNGPHHKGAMQTVRAEKRREAEERNTRTPRERTAAYRRNGR